MIRNPSRTAPAIDIHTSPEVVVALADMAEKVYDWTRRRGRVDWTDRAAVVDFMGMTDDIVFSASKARRLMRQEMHRTAQLSLFEKEAER